MQPKPISETSRPLLPNIRFCIAVLFSGVVRPAPNRALALISHLLSQALAASSYLQRSIRLHGHLTYSPVSGATQKKLHRSQRHPSGSSDRLSHSQGEETCSKQFST